MTQILTQDVATWRAQILAAVGLNGQVLIDVIPALELVIGPQPGVAVLPPPEAHVLFQALFVALVAVFATPSHPLVLFIDDLQWADNMSLGLLKLLFEQEALSLFLIGSAHTHTCAEHFLGNLARAV